MKKLLKIATLIFFCFVPEFMISQDSLKILTYNIQGMKPETNAGFRTANIISKLKTLDPDIIALQEINEDITADGSDNQCIRIANALSEHFGIEYYYYQQQTHLSWDNLFNEYIGIISKYQVTDKGFEQLATGVFPRKVVWNEINTSVGVINFFSTHLSFNSSEVRLQQVQQIKAYIDGISQENGINTNILCGDFNEQPIAASIEYLTNTESENFFYSSFFEANQDLPGYTVPSNSPNSKIDYVFYNNQSSIIIDTSYIVMDDPIPGGIYCSDHLGVMSVFVQNDNSSINHNPQYNKKPFNIYDVYPNPSDFSTTIFYELFKAGSVYISIFNLLGEEQKVYLNSDMPTGKHHLLIDTSCLKNSVSFLKIEVDGFVEARKLIRVN